MDSFLLFLLPFFPILGLPFFKLGKLYRISTLFFLFCSLATSLYLFIHLKSKILTLVFHWIPSTGTNISISYNNLSGLFSLLVILISIPVFFYSFFYVKKNTNYFIGILSFFVTSMLLLVLSHSYLNLFIAWELVGFISYLLVNFYGNKRSIFASNKTILINRIADMFLLAAIVLIYKNFHTFDYMNNLSNYHVSHTTINVIGVFLIIAAMAKSAQFPLHTWLLDAMEAPTPVSALLHAATMVTAGVYLLNISYIFYNQDLRLAITVIGALTIIIGGLLGVINRNIKKILASSTMSQLGFMFFAVSLGKVGFLISLFYLFMHASLKASLFLTAGNIMFDNKGELDLDKVSLKSSTRKILLINYLINAITLIGIPPFAIFYPKEELIAYSYYQHPYYSAIPILGTVFTAIYMARLYSRLSLSKSIKPDKENKYDWKLISIVSLTIFSLLAPLISKNNFFYSHIEKQYSNISLHTEVASKLSLTLLTVSISILFFIASLIIFKKYNFKDTKFLRKFGESFNYDLFFGRLLESLISFLSKIGYLVDCILKKIENSIYSSIKSSSCIIKSIYRGKFEDTILIALITITLLLALILLKSNSFAI